MPIQAGLIARELDKFVQSTAVPTQTAVAVVNPDGSNISGGGGTSSNLIYGYYNGGGTTSLLSGASGTVLFDVNQNVRVTEGTLIAGEDLANGVLKVEERFSYALATTAGTNTVKSGSGFLHSITIGNISSPSILIYDNTAGSGSLIHIFGPNVPVATYFFDQSFSTGLTYVIGAGVNTAVNTGYR